MRSLLPFLQNAKHYLAFLGNRQFFAFLFFLLLSASFWLFQTVNEVYEQEFDIPVRLVDVPENVVITTELPTHVRLTLRDRGVVLLRYRYVHTFAPIVVHFDSVATTSGHVSLATAELLKPVVAALESSTQALSVRPETMDFYFNYGLSKRVPVVVQGKFFPDSAYSIMAVDVEPREALVYASRSVLDTLTAAYLEPIRLHHLTDTTIVQRKFVKIPGMKYVPNQARLTIIADRMVEKTVEVPVQGVNFPADKTLRTFPAKVKVTFQVGMSQYKKVTDESFVIVINYADLIGRKAPSIPLSLKSTPYGVYRPRITPDQVDFIIEDINPSDFPDNDTP